MNIIYEKAYAKINLGLQILNKRTDGYHNIQSLMCTIDLFDELELELNSIIHVISDTYICEEKDNLVYKIAEYIQQKYNIMQGALIKIIKKIPCGYGLGGGSADAAATIRGLNRLWELNISKEDMYVMANLFGSDISFCIDGETAIVKGRGEIIEKINKSIDLSLVLICPKFQMSTAHAYSKMKIIPEDGRFEKLISNIDENKVYEYLFNDFETNLEIIYEKKEYDILNNIKAKLLTFGAEAVVMSGTGPTILGILPKGIHLGEFESKLSYEFKDCNYIFCATENVFIL